MLPPAMGHAGLSTVRYPRMPDDYLLVHESTPRPPKLLDALELGHSRRLQSSGRARDACPGR